MGANPNIASLKVPGCTECGIALDSILVTPKKYSYTLLEAPESREGEAEWSPEVTSIQSEAFSHVFCCFSLGNVSYPPPPRPSKMGPFHYDLIEGKGRVCRMTTASPRKPYVYACDFTFRESSCAAPQRGNSCFQFPQMQEVFLFELLLLPRGCYRHIRVNELVRSLKREQSLSKSVQTSFPSP